jgi:predicted RNase H-like HicB family nuclease
MRKPPKAFRASSLAHPSLLRWATIVRRHNMKVFTAVVEKCPDTGLYVGYVPGFPGAHTQGETLDELNKNLKEVIEMLLEDGFPKLETEFVGTQTVMVA